MSFGKTILWSAAAATAYEWWLFHSSFDYHVIGVNHVVITFTEIRGVLVLDIYNPLDFSITINHLKGDLFQNTFKVATINQPVVQVIRSKANSTLSIPFADNIGNTILSLLKNYKGDVNFKGLVNIGVGIVDFNYSIDDSFSINVAQGSGTG